MKKYIANNIDANIRIQKLGNVFINAQQMVVQFAICLGFSLPLYHSFQTFQFTNTSSFEEWAFVLKSQVALNEMEQNYIDIMCLSIIEKYNNRPNQYELLSLTKFTYFYNNKKNKIASPKLFGL
jgi:hypothetical protein